MSTQFVVEVPASLSLSLIEPDHHDVVWVPSEVGDPLPPGDWGVYRDQVSTRTTSLAYAPPRLTVTIRSGACIEDCDLALGIVRAAASLGRGEIETETEGTVAIHQLDVLYDDGWKRSQLESAARTTIALSGMRGVIAMPGPTREVLIGPRVVTELGPDDPGRADRLVAVMRRALWPDPEYLAATKFTASAPSGDTFSLAILFPGNPSVLPHTDRLALEDDRGTFLIPRSRLDDLPVEMEYLDDGNQLVEAISTSEWPRVCAAARPFEIPSPLGETQRPSG